MVFIGIDLGGTNIKGVLVNETGEVLKQHYIPTRDDPEGHWRGNVLDMVRYFKSFWQGPIEAVGLSAPGLPDETNQYIAFLPNRLPGLENFVWEGYLGLPAFVINDAHSALMAEASFGAAKAYKNVVLLTLGTGVGGGLLINGELFQGLSQMAGHLGHITVNAHDDECSIVGLPGSLEYAIGNYSIERRSRGRYTSTWELVEAYRTGEAFATYLWLASVKALAVGLCSMVNTFSPECIVLAGGITLADDALFTPLQTFMEVYEWQPGGKSTPIVQAYFGDMAGAIGAAGYAMKKR
ncbi:ROK family protein [Salmonirosea aquatica]|uniref:ROK family protein n=1 Tax=Salmonirosea aquatica TaxID=2654236 RepID=A0A7C9FPK4_9BACT|nr:ROK family protein [Cytophagaceae bacterium SJW1-29]